MAEVDERKALGRLGQALRNLTSGARLGESIPPAEDEAEPDVQAEQAAAPPPPPAISPPGP